MSTPRIMGYIDNLVQERHNSIAIALELGLSYTNRSILYRTLRSRVFFYDVREL